MVATVILSIGVLGLFGAFRYIARTTLISRGTSLATNLGQERIESLKNLSYYALQITTASATDATVSPSILYDTSNYPPETIAIGGITYTRYTYVGMSELTGSDITDVAFTYPDTGLKQIAVHASGKHVNHEGDVHEATPRGDVREVRDPQLVRARRREIPLHQIARRFAVDVRDRGLHATPAHDPAAVGLHQPGDGAARDHAAFAMQRLPDLLRAIHPSIGAPHARNLGAESGIALCARWHTRRSASRAFCS